MPPTFRKSNPFILDEKGLNGAQVRASCAYKKGLLFLERRPFRLRSNQRLEQELHGDLDLS